MPSLTTSLKPADKVPAKAERDTLNARLLALGYKPGELANVITAKHTREQVRDGLIEMQRQAKRAK